MTNRTFFNQRFAAEHPAFVHVFQALASDKLEWRPHARSRSATELVGHLIGHEQDLLELAETGAIHHRQQVPFNGLTHALELYRQAHEAVDSKLKSMDDATWDEKPGRFIVGEQVIYEMPYRDLMWMMLFDSIHHRGQLSTYIRPMGGKVPSIYGPSADDQGAH